MPRLPTVLLVLLALATVGCDQSTKHFAIQNLQDAPQALLPVLQLTYTENRDMAFGLLGAVLEEQARLWLLTIAKSAAILMGVVVLVTRRQISTNFERIGIALVLAGAAGNLIDRIRFGYVVDFLQVPYWPVFNVADMAIVAGMGLVWLAVRRATQAFDRTNYSQATATSDTESTKNDV